MKKIAFVSVLLFTFLTFTNSTTLDETVYVCGKSEIYHTSKTHNALGKCKSGISSMKESAAKKLGKRKCKCKS